MPELCRKLSCLHIGIDDSMVPIRMTILSFMAINTAGTSCISQRKKSRDYDYIRELGQDPLVPRNLLWELNVTSALLTRQTSLFLFVVKFAQFAQDAQGAVTSS